MSDEKEFLVPDYYPAFHCKMGACRHACCEGWPISVSMKDYFRLLSVECSAELRRKLDCALHLAPHPTPERYAQITPRYDNQCPLHLPDGRCALHAETGEEMLAAVCRLYPRGVRPGGECSCANSCEAVLELLLDKAAPLRFIRLPLTLPMPEVPAHRDFFHTDGREEAIRMWLISLLQRPGGPLHQRLLLLGAGLHAMEAALAARDLPRVDRLLRGEEAFATPEAVTPGHEQLQSGLDMAERMLAVVDQHSRSVHDYGEAALSFFAQGQEAFSRYEDAAGRFTALIPQWERWFEHILVNHMFFVQFPFQDRPVPLKDEYLSLCAAYVLLRFLCVGWTALHPTREAAVDAAAAAFRLIDHTSFDLYAGPLLADLGCRELTQLQQLLCL